MFDFLPDFDGSDTGGEANSDPSLCGQVSTRLTDFESQITAQLSNMQSDFDKKLSHVRPLSLCLVVYP